MRELTSVTLRYVLFLNVKCQVQDRDLFIDVWNEPV